MVTRVEFYKKIIFQLTEEKRTTFFRLLAKTYFIDSRYFVADNEFLLFIQSLYHLLVKLSLRDQMYRDIYYEISMDWQT